MLSAADIDYLVTDEHDWGEADAALLRKARFGEKCGMPLKCAAAFEVKVRLLGREEAADLLTGQFMDCYPASNYEYHLFWLLNEYEDKLPGMRKPSIISRIMNIFSELRETNPYEALIDEVTSGNVSDHAINQAFTKAFGVVDFMAINHFRIFLLAFISCRAALREIRDGRLREMALVYFSGNVVVDFERRENEIEYLFY